MTEERLPQVLARIPHEWGKTLRFNPGWDDLVARLDEDLADLDPDYVVQQAKEKFGELRYYIDLDRGYSPEIANEMFRLVTATEAASSRICEDCGAPGSAVSVFGWLATLCADCMVKRSRAAEERRRALSRPQTS